METDLTKRIKVLTHSFQPKIKSNMRTIRWADEVWTPTGIVDSIRFEDYYAAEEYVCPYIDVDRYGEKALATYASFRNKSIEEAGFGRCFRDNSTEKDDKKCHGCVFRHHTYQVGMMVTAFEVKITRSDFLSSNGHNFHGNENYYCVPKELAPKIENDVPSDIGILAYYSGKRQDGLRLYRKATWHDIDDATKVQLLYNAMKKWCDGATFQKDMLQ